jgi:hypothetical protein
MPFKQILCSQRNQCVWVTAVAQWLKTPGIHCYIAGSVPAVTPRCSTDKQKIALRHTIELMFVIYII